MQSMVVNVKMAVNLARLILKDFYLPKLNIVRNAHRIRGKPPGVARTLQQRIEHYKNLTNDELFTTKINIGFPSLSVSKTDKLLQRIDHIKKQRKDEKLEKLARKKELLVDLEEVEKDWYENNGPSHIKRIADHYGIYEHLYNEGYFLPKVHINVFYSSGDLVYPVYYGNVVKPSEATKAPEVSYESDKDSLWVLTLINLDGHLTEDGKEYIHWCVANIPGNNVKKGNTLVEYLQPIPPRGTGFHRYAFVLYKQDKKIDFSMKQVTSDSPLQDRTFNTRDWYQKHQDEVTPAGLAFFQADWDPSLTDFFHNGLVMKEPVFEYDFPKPYMQKQRWFPSRHPFNVYMDKHRDVKQINKEYFLRILKDEHPFKGPKPALKFPMAQAFPKEMPSWLKLHEKKIRLKWGRINEVL